MSEGELIIGNCKLQSCLATGNQTQVWEVVEQSSNEKYAMKLLLPDAFKDPVQKAALKHEAKVLETLDHSNIVKFKSLVMDKKNGFLLMELFRAPNLKSQTQTDLLSLHVRLKRLVEQVSQAMAHIHDKGWLHKDLKPDNILFSKAAELRIIDFSLSSKIPSGLSAMLPTRKRLIQGTRTYMAPEQIKCLRLGPYTDIYNFGITLFELLAGRTPFAGFTPNDLLKKHLSEPAPAPSMFNENVTPEMDRIVLKMLAKKPEARQKSFNELLAEIRNISLFKESPEKMMEQRIIDKENEGLREAALNERRDSRSDAKRAELAKAAAAESGTIPAAPAPAVAPVKPIQVPAAAAPVAAVPVVAVPQPPPAGAVPPRPGPPGAAPGRPPVGMPPPRPGMPPGMLPPGAVPPGGLPPGVRPPMPPGQPPRPGLPPGMPPGAMPARPGMPPPGAPRPPGAPVAPGALPPGMPPRPGVPAVAGGPGGPPRPLPPGMPPNAPRPGVPVPPGGGPVRPPMPGQPPRPGGPPPGPGGQLPPGVRPPGAVPPPPGGARPPGPPGPPGQPPRPVPPAPPPPSGEVNLDDFNVG